MHVLYANFCPGPSAGRKSFAGCLRKLLSWAECRKEKFCMMFTQTFALGRVPDGKVLQVVFANFCPGPSAGRGSSACCLAQTFALGRVLEGKVLQVIWRKLLSWAECWKEKFCMLFSQTLSWAECRKEKSCRMFSQTFALGRVLEGEVLHGVYANFCPGPECWKGKFCMIVFADFCPGP